MNSAFAAVKDHLDRHEWPYEAHQEDGVIVTGFALETSNFELYLECLDEAGLFKVFAPYPNRVPSACRLAVLEFCNQVNKNASLGRMVLDSAGDDGASTVASAIVTAFEPGDLRDAVIARCLFICANHCEFFQPALLSVVHGNADPRAAVDAAVAAYEARRAARATEDPE